MNPLAILVTVIASLTQINTLDQNAIVYFTDSCPPGYIQYTELTGRVPVGAGTGWIVGSTGGEETHTLTENEMPSHFHQLVRYQNSGPLNAGFQLVDSGPSGTYNARTNSAGGNIAHNNMQPYRILIACRKLYTDSYASSSSVTSFSNNVTSLSQAQSDTENDLLDLAQGLILLNNTHQNDTKELFYSINIINSTYNLDFYGLRKSIDLLINETGIQQVAFLQQLVSINATHQGNFYSLKKNLESTQNTHQNDTDNLQQQISANSHTQHNNFLTLTQSIDTVNDTQKQNFITLLKLFFEMNETYHKDFSVIQQEFLAVNQRLNTTTNPTLQPSSTITSTLPPTSVTLKESTAQASLYYAVDKNILISVISGLAGGFITVAIYLIVSYIYKKSKNAQNRFYPVHYGHVSAPSMSQYDFATYTQRRDSRLEVQDTNQSTIELSNTNPRKKQSITHTTVSPSTYTGEAIDTTEKDRQIINNLIAQNNILMKQMNKLLQGSNQIPTPYSSEVTNQGINQPSQTLSIYKKEGNDNEDDEKDQFLSKVTENSQESSKD